MTCVCSSCRRKARGVSRFKGNTALKKTSEYNDTEGVCLHPFVTFDGELVIEIYKHK